MSAERGFNGRGVPPGDRRQQDKGVRDGGAQAANLGEPVAFLGRKGEDGRS